MPSEFKTWHVVATNKTTKQEHTFDVRGPQQDEDAVEAHINSLDPNLQFVSAVEVK